MNMLETILTKETEITEAITTAQAAAKRRITDARQKAEAHIADAKKTIATALEDALRNAEKEAKTEAEKLLAETRQTTSQQLLTHQQAREIAKGIADVRA